MSAFKAKGILQKRGGKTVRVRGSGKLLWDCLLVISEVLPLKVFPTQPPKCELNSDDTNEYVKLNGEKPPGYQPYTKNYKHPKKAGKGRGSLP